MKNFKKLLSIGIIYLSLNIYAEEPVLIQNTENSAADTACECFKLVPYDPAKPGTPYVLNVSKAVLLGPIADDARFTMLKDCSSKTTPCRGNCIFQIWLKDFLIMQDTGVCSIAETGNNKTDVKQLNEDEIISLLLGKIHTSVYPNPVAQGESLIIEGISLSSVTIMDITGRIYGTTQASRNRVEISTTELSAGLYFIRVLNEDGSVDTKHFSVE